MTIRLLLTVAVLGMLAVIPARAGAALAWEKVIIRGDRACSQERIATKDALRRHRPYDPFSAYYANHAAFWREERTSFKRANRKLKSLLRRAEQFNRSYLRAYVRGRVRLARYERRVIRAAASGDAVTYSSRLYTFKRRNARNRPRGRRYGFQVCGKK
jgi:hypothetical protein